MKRILCILLFCAIWLTGCGVEPTNIVNDINKEEPIRIVAVALVTLFPYWSVTTQYSSRPSAAELMYTAYLLPVTVAFANAVIPGFFTYH